MHTHTTQDTKHILLATDLSETSQLATSYALSQAKHTGAALTLLHVFDPKSWTVPGPFYFMPNAEQWAEERIDSARDKARNALESLAQQCAQPPQILFLEGKPGPTIVQCAKEQKADLLVMGTHGRKGWQHAMLGSVAGHVTRHAHCSVLTINAEQTGETKANENAEIKHILVPIDFSEHAKDALKQAIAIAVQHNAELHLLHVINHLYMPKVYEQYTGTLEGDLLTQIEETSLQELEAWMTDIAPANLQYTPHVATGGAADRIQHFANTKQTDLIVIATHGNTGIKRFFLGSVAEQVLRYATCPVLIIR